MEAELRAAITIALQTLGVTDVTFAVEHPADLSHGDYATNVALVAAKPMGKNPRELAEELQQVLTGNIDSVEKIEIAGPGFINFYLTRDFFVEKITHISTAGEHWGANESWRGKKVIVEYTDPNPFKEFHIGHLFTNTVGESIARLFMASGADVKRVNYQGDVGMHVANAMWGLQKLDVTVDTELTPKLLGEAYATGATAYKAGGAAVEEIKVINKAIYERTDEVINALYDKGREVSLTYFETIYQMLDTQFDDYFFESEAGPIGRDLVLAHPEVFRESDGARVFQGEEYGLHTRVFVNGDGLPTYEAKELALAKLKEERLGAYDHSIIATANEITEYFKVLLKAMSFIYPELAKKTEHIGHGTVRLASGKMSSRTGQVIAAVDFITDIKSAALEKMIDTATEGDEVVATDIAIAAVKYATLQGNVLQDSVFDKERALSFEGDSGPYLQYTHARICSVLEKAEAAGIHMEVQPTCIPPEPYQIERLLYQLPEVVKSATNDRAPHQLVGYLTELAGAFNAFYAKEKIADPDDEYAPYKAALADAVRITLENGLWGLGIKAPQRM